MKSFNPHHVATRAVALAAVLGTAVVASQGFAAGAETSNGAAVTVLKATRSCFSDTVEVAGILIPKNETAVRPERPGLKVTEILVEPGQSVTAGQVLARLNRAEGGSAQVQAPVAGLVSHSTAEIGAIASGKGEALFNIVTGNEFDLVGQVPTPDLAKLAVGQTAKVVVVGAGDMDGKVRLVAPTVEPNSQLGQVFISVDPNRHLLVNASGRAIVKTGESCGIAVPLTAQDRRELRHRGAPDGDPVWKRGHGCSGRPAPAGRNAARRGGIIVGGTGRGPRGIVGRRRGGGARRRPVARRRSGQTDRRGSERKGIAALAAGLARGHRRCGPERHVLSERGRYRRNLRPVGCA